MFKMILFFGLLMCLFGCAGQVDAGQAPNTPGEDAAALAYWKNYLGGRYVAPL
ncbi:MAG: hypothetical protein LBK98_10060 [Peptococcaceae bacterium]|jgi:hypothetical protein|nr:hypothetical protein [Peptococcaceae bacterium]